MQSDLSESVFTPLPSIHDALVVNALQCIRDDRILFEQLHFTLSSGELLQIEGRNGSGKTSLLRILCGLTLASEGQVLWRTVNIEEDGAAYWAELAYVGHAAGVKGDLTPLENLAIAQALSAQTTGLTAMAALDALGLYGYEDVPTRTLSAGQQRRVALARLLVCQATLWILDEPFTALDKGAIQFVEELLTTHTARGGLAIVTSHHPVQCVHKRVLQL